MSAFSYSVRIGVDKELPPVSSGNYAINFCSTNAANQTPPRLTIALAAFGTAAVNGVIAECYTVGTADVTLLPAAPFATAIGSWVYLRESSGHANASLRLVKDVSTVNVSFSALKAGDVAFFRHDGAYPLQANAVSTSATGTVQVVCIGD